MTDQPGRLATSSFWSLVDNFAQQVLSFIFFALLARFLSPQAFGLLTIAHLFIQFTRFVFFDAIVMPIVRSAKPEDRDFSWAFSVCVVAAIFLFLLMLGLSGTIADAFGSPELTPVLQGMSLTILAFGISRAYEARMTRTHQFKSLAIRSVISVLIGGMTGVTLAAMGFGVLALVVQQVATAVFACLLLIMQSPWRPRLSFQKDLALRYRGEMSRAGISGITSYASTNSDSLLISIFLSPYFIGIYNLAKRIASSVYLVITSSVLKVTEPIIAHVREEPALVRERYLKILALVLLLTLLPLCGLALFSEPLISRLFGVKWMSAAPVLIVLSWVYVLLSIQHLNQTICFVLGHYNVPIRVNMIGLTITALVVSLIHDHGLLAMTYAFLFSSSLLLLPYFLLILKYTQTTWRDLGCAAAPPLLAALMMTVTALVLNRITPVNDSLMTFAGQVMAAFMTFMLTLVGSIYFFQTKNPLWEILGLKIFTRSMSGQKNSAAEYP